MHPYYMVTARKLCKAPRTFLVIRIHSNAIPAIRMTTNEFFSPCKIQKTKNHSLLREHKRKSNRIVFKLFIVVAINVCEGFKFCSTNRISHYTKVSGQIVQ